MANKYFFIFSLLILSSVVFSNLDTNNVDFNSEATLDLNPFLVEKAQYLFQIHYNISPSNGKMSEVLLNISIPSNSNILFASSNYTIFKDEDGNTFLSVFYPQETKSFEFFANLSLETSAQHLYSLEQNNINQESLPTKYFKPNQDKNITDLAINITKNYSTDFEKIAALALFTHNLINYDISAVNQNYSVQEILKIKKGVCRDYSLLFATLASSLGYKTRFVHGYAYNSLTKTWLGHVWVEVYLGKWIAVDPTWLEVGFLDATHITRLISYTVDDNNLLSLKAFVPKGASLDISSAFESLDPIAKPSKTIVPLSINLSKRNFIKNVIFSNEVISPNDDFYIIVNLSSPKEFFVSDLSMDSCLADSKQPFFISSDNKKTLILQPNINLYIFSKFSLNKNAAKLEPNIKTIFTCPISISLNNLNDEIVKDITMKSYYEELPKLNAFVLKSVVGLGEEESVIVQKNDKLRKIFLLTKNTFLTNNSENPIFVFFPYTEGKNSVLVFSDGYYQAKELEFFSLPLENLSINISFSSTMLESRPEKITFFIPQKIFEKSKKKLYLVWQAASEFKQIQIYSQNISIDFVPQETGYYSFFYYIKDEDNNLLFSNYSYILVLKKPSLSIENYSIKKEENLYLVEFKLKKEGNFSSLYANLKGKNNQTYKIDSDKFVFRVIDLPSNIEFVFLDTFNNTYFLNFSFSNSSLPVVNKKEELSLFKSNFIFENLLYFIFVALIILLTIVLYIKLYKKPKTL
ncbi:MAG: transglutaminase-like domain-containing protein [Candidatus Anstonellaceae archaeon]